MSARGWVVAVACALAPSWVACSGEVRSQFVVTVRTDAPIPLVGDRVMLEITNAAGDLACEGCRRFVDVHELAAFPVSFGIVPPSSATGLRVRARMYRARSIGAAGVPPASTTIDAVARLPAGAPESLVRVALELRMSCFGVASDAEHTCDPSTSALADIGGVQSGDGDPNVRPGSWPGATPTECDAASAPVGMLCGPAGLVFLGSPLDVSEATERLARIDAYYIDVDEFSVGRARTLVRQKKVSGEPLLHVEVADDPQEFCSYRGPNDASHDDDALNCVSLSLARAMCEAEGKSLPTEAEYAAAAKNGALETLYPWGADEDVCAHAVVARGVASAGDPIDCRTGASTPAGPEPLTAPTRDVTIAPAGIRRLGGNLTEWMLDDFARFTETCWSSPPVLDNPRCVDSVHAATTRGGHWDGLPAFAKSYFRSGSTTGPQRDVGFRCVKR